MNHVMFHDIFEVFASLRLLLIFPCPWIWRNWSMCFSKAKFMTQKVGLFVTLVLYGLPILEFNPQAQKMQNFRYTSNHYRSLRRRLQGGNLCLILARIQLSRWLIVQLGICSNRPFWQLHPNCLAESITHYSICVIVVSLRILTEWIHLGL